MLKLTMCSLYFTICHVGNIILRFDAMFELIPAKKWKDVYTIYISTLILLC